MIKAVFDFYQIHREVILRDTPVIVENVLSLAPESLNAVDVIFGAFVDEGFMVTDRMVLAKPLERSIPAEGVGVVDRSLPGACLDMVHQRLGRDRLDHFGIDPAFPLQQTENDAFAGSATTSLAFAPTTEIRLIQFDLAFESAALQLTKMKQSFAQILVDASDDFDIQPQIDCEPISRLKLVEPLQNRNLPTQPGQALGLAATAAFDVTACRTQHLERTTKNTLAAPQKVGRTTKMTAFPNNHRYLPYTFGYKTP